MSATPERKQPRDAAGEAAFSLDRAVKRAGWVLLWERLWPPLALIACVVGIFLAVAWAGLFVHLPPLGRIVGVVLFALAFILSFIPLLKVRRPDRADALARLDRGSRLAHRPATALADSLATRPDDPVGSALWRAHLSRMLGSARALRPGLPAPALATRDPRAYRALALLAVVATFFLASGEHLSRLKAAFDWRGVVTPKAYRLDAWIDPPGYTGRPPVVLPGLRSDDPTQTHAAALTVPAGSTLVVRTVGLDDGGLKTEGGIAEVKPEAADPQKPATPGAVERRFTIGSAGSVTATGPDQRSVFWRFAASEDQKPAISFVKDPQPGPRNTLVLTYRIEDDYGVKEANATFAALPPEKPFFPRPGAPDPVAGTPLIPPPDFPLTVPAPGAKSGAQASRDLIAHPWAGARVAITLKARDEAGQEASSETKIFRLPARPFTKPLARALVEERRRLALDVAARTQVEGVLAALTLAPDQFGIAPNEYLGVRSAYWRLRNASNDDDLRGVVDYLWDMALAIEDGDLSDAQRALRAAQEALREALERGAPDEEIQRLMQDLRAAMDKMMRQLAEEARRDGGTDARPLDPNTRVMRPQDLQRMMDRIENLARSGARDAARQMLDELQAMMENMRPGSRQAGRQQGQQGQGELGNMIQEQQRLRDRTYRQGQGQQGQQGQGQQGQGQRGQQGQQQGREGEYGDVQQGQGELRKRLGEMMDQLRRMQQGQGQGQQGQQGQGQQGQDGEGQDGQGGAAGRAGDAFGRADQAMRDAERALGQGDGQGALDAQGRALQALRQGAQALAEGQPGGSDGPGPGGPSGEQAQRTDPLGRPMRNQDYGDDYSVKVPEEMDVQRARQVLEELRRRLEQTSRPQIELDYIERLLENF
ncbi:TIGR02302 family protein [Aquabacter cavernae]|uniref:TIGR02302 family protein n=1 Tax=Aquabacter cavernae TaxID=2496029 RepID=UPI000F8E9A41|nr:TIGR02302 family protein [Aquabacter cavernae]